MGNAFTSITKYISVEPTLIFAFLALGCMLVPTQVGLIRVLCEKYKLNPENNLNETTVDCWSPNFGLDPNKSLLINWNAIEITLQQEAASWYVPFSLAYTIPCIFSDTFLGSYSDLQGRKYNIILGLLGTSGMILCWTFLLAWPQSVSMYVGVLGYFLGGLTGYMSIVSISSAAYIADTVVEKNKLTQRMTILQICMGVASIIGPLVAKGFMTILSFSQTLLVALAFAILGIISTCVILRQLPPHEMRKRARMKKGLSQMSQMRNEEEKIEKSFVEKCRVAVFEAVNLIRAVKKTFIKKREGHRRAYLYLVSLAVFVDYVCDVLVEGIILNLFMQMAPFHFDQNQISDYKSVASAITLAGALLGIFVLKKKYDIPDTFLMIISLASSLIRCLITAFSTRSWMLYLAAGSGFLFRLMSPSALAFLAKIVEPDEYGKASVAFSVGSNLAQFVNHMVFTTIYGATVAFFPGFVFLLSAVLLFVMMCVVIWIHVDFYNYALLRFWKRDLISVKL